jgi:saccharopine dehydrogenase-like NADP-dependent oxidoreductase
VPAAFTAAVLAAQRQFRYEGEEQDMAFIRADVRGTRAGKPVRIIHDLVDTRDLETGFTAMQRTVGFTLALGARLILDGKLAPGLRTPLDVPYELVFPALERHGMRVQRREESWEVRRRSRRASS